MPKKLMQSVLSVSAPMNSIEGFVRQLIWREYVKHVHDITEGFRSIKVNKTTTARRDAMWYEESDRQISTNHESHPNRLNQVNNLPMAYWNGDSGCTV